MFRFMLWIRIKCLLLLLLLMVGFIVMKLCLKLLLSRAVCSFVSSGASSCLRNLLLMFVCVFLRMKKRRLILVIFLMSFLI